MSTATSPKRSRRYTCGLRWRAWGRSYEPPAARATPVLTHTQAPDGATPASRPAKNPPSPLSPQGPRRPDAQRSYGPATYGFFFRSIRIGGADASGTRPRYARSKLRAGPRGLSDQSYGRAYWEKRHLVNIPTKPIKGTREDQGSSLRCWLSSVKLTPCAPGENIHVRKETSAIEWAGRISIYAVATRAKYSR